MELINQIENTGKAAVSGVKKIWKPLLIIALIAVIIYAGYRAFLHYKYKVDFATIKKDIAGQTGDVATQKLLLEGCESIVNNPSQMRQVIDMAKASNADINMLIVDTAIEQASNNGFINNNG